MQNYFVKKKGSNVNKGLTSTAFVCDTNMAMGLLFWDTNMAMVLLFWDAANIANVAFVIGLY